MKPKTKRAWVCGTTWLHELGETAVTLYPSQEDLIRNQTCWDDPTWSCGMIEVEVRQVTWMDNPELTPKLLKAFKQAVKKAKKK